MRGCTKILPGTGRGTMRSMVEGRPEPLQLSASPSTTRLRRAVPLPILGRSCS